MLNSPLVRIDARRRHRPVAIVAWIGSAKRDALLNAALSSGKTSFGKVFQTA